MESNLENKSCWGIKTPAILWDDEDVEPTRLWVMSGNYNNDLDPLPCLFTKAEAIKTANGFNLNVDDPTNLYEVVLHEEYANAKFEDVNTDYLHMNEKRIEDVKFVERNINHGKIRRFFGKIFSFFRRTK